MCIRDRDNKLITGFENIPKPKTGKKIVFYDTTYTNQNIRALYIEYEIYRSSTKYPATIIVAETLEDRKEWISNILLITILITFLIVIVAIVASLYSVKKGLEPLVNLENFIKRRDMHDLSMINEKVPREVNSLVQSINQLFFRLKNSFLHVERFNADISHQLRTPLAELKVLMQTDDILLKSPKKTQYLEIINVMAHTTQQLLLSAKTDPDAFDRDWFSTINLTQLCDKVAMAKVPFIYSNGFEFEFDVGENLWISGGPIILEGLLTNLIDNAVKYAVDEEKQPMGTITLSLKRKDDFILLSVEDEGYGIPKEHLDNIFERFFRLDRRKQGSGLGLSIVKQIAQLHNAPVEIKNKEPHGLKVIITFKSL